MPDATSHNTPPPAAAVDAARGFADRFGRSARWVAAAPGRVNLIGEHVDYCGGFVLPMAIDRYTAIAAAPGDEPGVVRLGSGMMDGPALRVDLRGGRAAIEGAPAWARYVLGVVELMRDPGDAGRGFDAWIESDVPPGAGLSSSAALEVATATLINAMTGTARDAMDTARLCQRAEHEFAGVPCGIMDMAVSVAAIAGHAVLLDCRDGRVEHVPMDDPAVCVLIANTNVRHELSDGAYAQRRAQCERAAAVLGVPMLRDATMPMLEAAADRLDAATYRRARHVIGEIERTVDASALLRRREWAAFGERMNQSHASLRDDFEVSCAELDTMVDLAHAIGVAGGVYGSRMTGGGFGGCTVSLVATDRADAVASHLGAAYRQATGIAGTIFVTRAARGAHVVDTAALYAG